MGKGAKVEGWMIGKGIEKVETHRKAL